MCYTFMMVYVWGRRNSYTQMSFMGLFVFTAPYLPWVLLGFSILIGSSPAVDLLGMAAGHVYYFLQDVYPQMTVRAAARDEFRRSPPIRPMRRGTRRATRA